MNALTYLLLVNLYLLLFYLFYLALLRNETFFKLNRFYLVGSAALALFIPLLRADWIKELFVTEKVQQLAQNIEAMVTLSQTTTTLTVLKSEEPSLSPIEWISIIYILVTAIFLINFLRKLYLLNQVLKRGNKGQAFSFFNKVSVDDELEGRETILKHELVHAKQWHSADVIFFELFTAMNWFNPISYRYKKAIKNIHEFIADETAASTSEDKSAYAILLFSNAFDTQPQQLTNSFYNHSLLKRRIIMLQKTKSRKAAILKYGLSVPLFTGMVIFSSATSAGTKAITLVEKNIYPLIEKLDNRPPILAEPQQTTQKESSKVTPTTKPLDTGAKNNVQASPANLMQYVGTVAGNSVDAVGKEGNIYVSFKVDKAKNAREFKIKKSIGSAWEQKFIDKLNSFKDTVNLLPGKYYFIQGFAYTGNEDLLKLKENENPIFTKWIIAGPTFGVVQEIEEQDTVINLYLSSLSSKEPLVLVDGKTTKYVKDSKGLKLLPRIFPREVDKIIMLKGDKATSQYGEEARKGIVVITTKATNEPN